MTANLKWAWIWFATAAVSAISFFLFRSVRKVEDLYDDLLDTKAELKVERSKQKVLLAQDKYAREIEKYLRMVANDKELSVTFIPSFDPDNPMSSADFDPDSDDLGEASTVPRNPKLLQ